MAYIDYAYYKMEYGGTAIPDTAFPGLALQAEAYVDKITFDRIGDVTNAVKNSVCAVCDVLYSIETREGIQSESNDGYSVTYRDDVTACEQQYYAARLFLPPELLYRGVDE